MFKYIKLLILTLFLIVAHSAVLSQTLYKDDLKELIDALKSQMAQAEIVSQNDEKSQFTIKLALFEISKKLHTLSENAIQADIDLMRQNNKSNRQLLLVSATAEALDYAQALTHSYISTHDRIFWNIALISMQNAKTLFTALNGAK